jgi:type III pantothenate kinase
MGPLLLDVGNTRLKWALLAGGSLQPGGAIEHHGDPARALSELDLPAATVGTRGLAANVTGPDHSRRLQQAARARWGLALDFVEAQAERDGLRVAYAEPARLGVDRWLQMLALWQQLRGGFVVASAGTALTFDAVDGHGRHLGGVIAPGLLTAQQAVLGATRFAADAPRSQYTEALGDNTERCVRQGALHACAGLLERLAGLYAAPGTPCILSGGDAATLLPALRGSWTVRGELVLEGLAVLAAGG